MSAPRSGSSVRRARGSSALAASSGAAVRALLLALVALSAGGCTALDNALAKIPFFAFMRESPGFDPYEATRPPPANSVPFESPAGDVPPMTEATAAALTEFGAGPYGVNPLDPNDPAVLEWGQELFLRHCMVCHNTGGEGNGPIVAPGTKFPMGPSLLTPTARGYSDGYIYALIRAGRGLMPEYGPRTTHLERWAIVSYVRQLQAASADGTAPGAPGGAGAPAANPDSVGDAADAAGGQD